MRTETEGRLVGERYLLGEQLGRGGMAEVYAATDERLGRPVAVKLMLPQLAHRDDIRLRFEAEARAAARLSHPNVVGVYDTGEDGGIPYIVMERLPGETLADRLRTGAPLDQAWVARVAGDVLGALDAAHGAGIIHRDIKPGNILIGENGCAKVADFGIAKSAEVDGSHIDLTTTNLLIGTPAYLAPERISGEPATARTDLYALGVVLYEALGGKKPFSGPTPMSVALAIQHDDPPPLDEVRPDVDPHLAAVVRRAMARNAGERFASAADMLDALEGEAHDIVAGGGSIAAGGVAAFAGPDDPTAAMGAVHRELEPTSAFRTETTTTARDHDGIDAFGDHDDRVMWPDRRPRAQRALFVGVAILLLLLLLGAVAAAVSRGGAADDSAAGDPRLAAQMRDLAERMKVGDGVKGPEASERLSGVADAVEATGGGAEQATALLRDATAWRSGNQLYATAYDQLRGLLVQVPGVDQAAGGAPTTAAPPPTQPAPAAATGAGDGGDDDDGGKGKGKGKGEKDD